MLTRKPEEDMKVGQPEDTPVTITKGSDSELNQPPAAEPTHTFITKCDSCKRSQSRISPRDTQRLLEFPGHLLKCGHKVCGECFPYCDVCDPIMF